jgi:hypothetical protein
MEAKEKLIISDIINGTSAVSSDDGQLVYEKMEKALQNDKKVELDFKDIEILTTAFLNAAIGQLYSNHTSEELNSRLKVENVSQEDLTLFKKVIHRAKEYYTNPKGFEDSANNAIYGS